MPGMTPEQQAQYNTAMQQAGLAAGELTLGELALLDEAARGSSARPTLSASEMQAQRDAFAQLPFSEQMRIAGAGADIPTSLGVEGEEGKFYTDPTVAASFKAEQERLAYWETEAGIRDLLASGNANMALEIIQKQDPQLFAMLTNKESSPYDKNIGGQSFRTQTTTWEQLIAGRWNNYTNTKNIQGAISSGRLNEVLTAIGERDPQLLAALANKETSPYDFDVNGNSFRGETTTYEQLIAGRLNNYLSGGGKQSDSGLSPGDVVSLLTGIPNAQGIGNVAATIVTGDKYANTGDWLSTVTGVPGLGEGQNIIEGKGTLGDVLGVVTPGTQTEVIPSLITEGQEQIDAIPDEQVPQGPTRNTGADNPPATGGDGTGGTTNPFTAGPATAVTPLNRADFEVEQVAEPWLTDEMKALPGQLWTEGMNYVPADTPIISEGSPELLAAYEDAIRKQMGIAEGVALSAEQQSELVRRMEEGRSLYEAAARGEAPSVAALQMQQGIDAAARNALSIAATSRDPGGYYRAQRSIGNLRNQGVIEQSILRAKEMADARAGLTAYLGTEATAGAYATQGGSQAAGAQQQITQDMITRLAQQQGISEEQARIELQNRQQEEANRINIVNAGTNAFNARTGALTGEATENRAVAEGQRAFAETQAEQETTMRGQDIGASTNLGVAQISSQTQKELAANQAKREDTAAWIKGAATAGAMVYDAASSDSPEEQGRKKAEAEIAYKNSLKEAGY